MPELQQEVAAIKILDKTGQNKSEISIMIQSLGNHLGTLIGE